MATITERLAIVVDANAGKAIAQFKTLGNATKGLSGDVGKAGGLLSSFSGQLGGLAGAAGVAGIAAAFAKFTASGVSGFIDLASQVAEFKRVAGGTAEDASRLVSAFKMVGIDASTAATGVFMLEKKLAAGADKLAAFGVTAIKNSKGQTDMSATLLEVGDAYKRIADPVQRAALLTAAFGRQGRDLIPLLGKSRKEIEAFFDAAGEHHEILSDDDLKAAREYKLAMRELGETFKGLQREAGKALVPFITDVAHTITMVLELTDKVGDLLNIKQGAGAHQNIGGWFDDFIRGKKKADDTTDATHSLGDAFDKIIGPASQLRQEADADAAAFAGLDKALTSAADADRALVDAHENLTDANADLNKLLKETAVDAEKVADAQRSLGDATRSVGHAQREQAKAQKEYDEALKLAQLTGSDTANDKLADAKDNLADANDNVTSSLDRQKDAQQDLAKAKAGDPDYQDKLAAARHRVADAEDAVAKNALAVARAQDEQAKALKTGADEAGRLLDFYDGLIKKYPEAQKALQPLLSLLQGAATPTPAAPPPVPVPAVGGLNTGGAGKTNNITVNVNSDRQIDPTHLSRTIIWDLN
jgi:hypothetical protein